MYLNLITRLRLSKKLCRITHLSKHSKILQKKEITYIPSTLLNIIYIYIDFIDYTYITICPKLVPKYASLYF